MSVRQPDMLRSKFWTGLRDEKLKLLTRHKFDTILNYDRLLREVRAAEQEMSATNKLATARTALASIYS